MGPTGVPSAFPCKHPSPRFRGARAPPDVATGATITPEGPTGPEDTGGGRADGGGDDGDPPSRRMGVRCGGGDVTKSPAARAAWPSGEGRLATCRAGPYKTGRRAALFWHTNPRTQNYAPALFGGYVRGKRQSQLQSGNRKDSN